MYWLIAGLVIFFGVHIFSSFRAAREKMIRRLGEKRYKAGYALLAVAGFILIVIGVGKAERVPLWEPAEWGRYAALWFMPFAFISLAAAFIRSNFQRFTAHPMLWGVTLWALLHLLATGSLTGLMLFGGFGLYAVHAMSSQNARGARPSQSKRPLFNDAAVVVAGLILYWLFLNFHAELFGVPVVL
ncbi:MAG TPA: NnrU family protein [Burkholderiales bacterium]|nr:NnrU family protein [Burkholderiales bacterium]